LMAWSHRRCRTGAQGQRLGRCRTGARAGRASRAGTVVRCRRRVAPRARAWRSPARVPAAWSRLWAIAVHGAQAELAPKCPDGRWARGPSIRSANTVSMMAWRRWVMSACAVGRVELVRNG
jgi:hypothetical protein